MNRLVTVRACALVTQIEIQLTRKESAEDRAAEHDRDVVGGEPRRADMAYALFALWRIRLAHDVHAARACQRGIRRRSVFVHVPVRLPELPCPGAPPAPSRWPSAR